MKLKLLKLPSVSKSIAEIESYVEQIAIHYNIGEDRYPNILISLTEAVNNAIIHGNNEDETKYVDVQVRETPNGLCFEVHDEGKGFNPKDIPDPTAPENLECCGGRGVFLMKELSDSMDYRENGRIVDLHFNFK
jgi:serine/threonine-protein kinase RsbW